MVSKGMLQQETAAAAAVGTTAPGAGAGEGVNNHAARPAAHKATQAECLRHVSSALGMVEPSVPTRLARLRSAQSHNTRPSRDHAASSASTSLAAAAIAAGARLLLGLEPD